MSELVAFGKFRVVGKSYTKGAWVVYDAVEVTLERPVELRLYNRILPEGGELERAFVQRMRQVAALDHPNILGILDFGIVNQKGYVTTAPRRARSLQYMWAENELDGLDAETRLQAVLSLVDALRHMHSVGMVHGSIATDTIFWDQGRDFPYFAWFPALEDAVTEFSSRIALVPAGYEGVQADVYRLARIAYQLMLGREPPSAQAPAALHELRRSKERDETQVLLDRALDPDPAASFPDAAGLLAELKRLQARLRVRSELEKSVSSMQLPEELLQKALERRREQVRPLPGAARGRSRGLRVPALGLAALLGGMLWIHHARVLDSPAATATAVPTPAAPGPAATPPPAPTPALDPVSARKSWILAARPMDGGLEALRNLPSTTPEDFPGRWATLRAWILTLDPTRRRRLFSFKAVVELRLDYEAEPASACRKLDVYIRRALVDGP